MNIAIIDYRSGNLHSAMKSFQFASSDLKNASVKVTSCYKDILKADKLVLPGVGSFSFCKSKLLENTDVYKALFDRVIEQKTPFLGICVGMQLLATMGHEGKQNNSGLGWISGEVKKIVVEQSFKIPHMGWNELKFSEFHHPVLKDLDDGAHAYFVHSYHMVCSDRADILAATDYGGPVTAAVGRDNLFGTQFHPEKSQANGLKLIRNFLNWTP